MSKAVLLVSAIFAMLAACSPSFPPTSTPLPLAPDPIFTPPSPFAAPTSDFIEATPNAPLNVRGSFVYGAGDGSLSLQRAQDTEPIALVERAKDSIAQLPAFSPDGTRVIYSALLFLPEDNLRGDLREVNVASKTVQTVLQAEANDVVYLYPRYGLDGRLLVTRIDKPQTVDENATLEWVNLDGDGKQTRVMEDARDGDVSADGTKIAFIRQDINTMRSSLWIADADGSNARQLVDDQTFTTVFAPRFSPDGKWLAFSVHGVLQKNVPLVAGNAPLQIAAGEENDCGFEFLWICWLETAQAHNAPGALWRIRLDTGAFQQLTDVYDDSPISAWSRDGAQIAIHDFTGIRLIDLTRHEIYPLFLEDGGSGGFDWSEP